MIKKKQLSKIGIGTWGIGGMVNKNPDNDDLKQVHALRFMLDSGMNFIEGNMWAADGHSAYLTSQAYKQSGVSREEIFLTQTVYQFTAKNAYDVERELHEYMGLFSTDYIDALQFSLVFINLLGYDTVINILKKYLSENKIRYISITNSNLEYLKKFHHEFGDKLFAHEVGYNFEIRENEDLGITGYAKENDILNVIFQPLRRNRTAKRDYILLQQLSQKYNKTQNQIILNWIVSKGFLPITKSDNEEHIKQHLDALTFNLEKDDIEKINAFRVPGYTSPKIDWYRDGNGTPIDQLSNVFDDLIPKTNLDSR